jgi:hypothetical protein
VARLILAHDLANLFGLRGLIHVALAGRETDVPKLLQRQAHDVDVLEAELAKLALSGKLEHRKGHFHGHAAVLGGDGSGAVAMAAAASAIAASGDFISDNPIFMKAHRPDGRVERVLASFVPVEQARKMPLRSEVDSVSAWTAGAAMRAMRLTSFPAWWREGKSAEASACRDGPPLADGHPWLGRVQMSSGT